MKKFLGLFVFLLVFCVAFTTPVHALDLVITAANVAQASGVPQQYTSGGTLTQGQCVYLNSSNQVVGAQSNASGTATVLGIALNAASKGQPVTVLTSGVITIGATTTKGTIYVVSAANAGGIAPIGDLATGNYLSIIGYANSTTQITLTINATGVTLP
ncbi:MAG: DUF2190 family protein [Patescibacteria group bacterium]|nr:DUF2190 family protein [Patescibacteria group bacterium]